jgi:hypothetical protein
LFLIFPNNSVFRPIGILLLTLLSFIGKASFLLAYIRLIMFAQLRRSPYAVTGSKLPTAVGPTPAPQNIISLTLFINKQRSGKYLVWQTVVKILIGVNRRELIPKPGSSEARD